MSFATVGKRISLMTEMEAKETLMELLSSVAGLLGESGHCENCAVGCEKYDAEVCASALLDELEIKNGFSTKDRKADQNRQGQIVRGICKEGVCQCQLKS